MKQGFKERQIARAKVIFSARLPSSAGFFLLRFLIHKSNPLQSAKSKLACACRLHSNQEITLEVTTSGAADLHPGRAFDLRGDGRD
jgi:hypothetical protein